MTGRSSRSLVFVSAGLGPEGGGRSAAARSFASSTAAYAARQGLGFEVLSLGAEEPILSPSSRRFAGRKAALAWAVLRREAAEGCALIFDLLGLARVQALLPEPRRAPYAVILHGIEVWRPLSLLHRHALHGARVPVAVSGHTLHRAEPYTGRLAGACVVALTLEDSPPSGESSAVPPLGLAPGYLLIAGRMARSERYKGHEPLLRALALLVARRPETHLVITGDGDDRPRLEALARELNVAGHVTFTGFVDAGVLPALYQHAAAFVMPSTGEGFGLVYLEAMRAGLPSVAAAGTVAEEVLGGEAGLLVPPDDVPALAEACQRLLLDRALAARLGEAGRARLAREYSRQRFDAAWSGVLDRLLQDHVRH